MMTGLPIERNSPSCSWKRTDGSTACGLIPDKGGTTNLRQKAVRQRRDGIASDVYRAVCDMEHMNKVFHEQLTFFLDFADDVAERRAADLLRDNEDDQDEAA
jgi:hypothetical protein